MPRIVACGGRQKAYEDFCAAQKKALDVFIALLVDSEEGVEGGAGPWEFLERHDNWRKPDGTTDDNAHLMVQCMEAWFLADPHALARFFGNGFNANPLPKRRDLENIPKQDIYDALESATRASRKKEYRKSNHSFALLAALDPGKVTDASPHVKRLVETLLKRQG